MSAKAIDVLVCNEGSSLFLKFKFAYQELSPPVTPCSAIFSHPALSCKLTQRGQFGFLVQGTRFNFAPSLLNLSSLFTQSVKININALQ